MSEQVQVKVEILGRNFTVNTPEPEKAVLERAAQMLNGKIAAVQKAAPNWENDKVAIMASLNLSYDLFKTISESQNQAKQTLAESEIARTISPLISLCDSALADLES